MGRQLNLSVRGGDKATRKAARGFMLRYGVMQMLATGAMGFPLWLPAGVAGGFAGQAVAKAAGTNQRTGTAIGATLGMALMTAFAAGLGADDDEPWDWNAELRSFCRQLAEKITGDQVVMGKGDDNHSAEVLMDLLSKGMPALLGWDVSGRIGANDLLWRNDDNPRLSNEQGFVGIMQSFLGSINIWGGKITRAVDQAGNGQYGKATEQLLPTAVANPIKAARQAIHGVTTGNGGKRPIEFGVYDFINQVAGLSPVAVRRELDYARDVNNRSVGLAIRQSDIKEAWANANQVTDPESRAAEKRDVIKMMQQFNQGKTIDRLSRRELDGYLKSRRRQQQTLDGTRRASRSQREAEASLDQ
ncbi:PLxRFG domain-containing protein [Deefgea sp. CFH1-16]|uniref:PLxRFG domain-containing protein n=1 Tax=Deefgea sp. CFH1-16 TaxID=2675457 RepID=UPI0015F6BF8D|nr:PLxRFG domain-containing protein [Deefgea sp. CFH1-16]MBM5575845.1 PLxRFG domain-containing protein [Deefgea sp. CFH1-16]